MRKSKAAVIAFCLFLAVMFPIKGQATGMSSITSDSIKDKQNQISQAEDQREKLEGLLTDIKSVKKKLEREKNNLKKYLKELDGTLTEIQGKISELEALIRQKEQEILVTQGELDAALVTEESQYEFIRNCIQLMYEQGDTYYLDILFGGKGIGDILNRMEYVEQLARYNDSRLKAFIANRQLIEYSKMLLDEEKLLLDEAKTGVESEKAALEELIAEKSRMIQEYETNINTKAQAIKEYEEEIREQDELIEALEAAVEEERKQILKQNGIVLEYDGGAFKFPVAKYTRVSSPYGWRLHPTLGVDKFHNGVDLASPSGTAIYAAYDGTVVAAAYSSTMGNYVMINHGGGLYTIYMHASKLYVSTGDIVARGNTIAAVGSTGRSTGPHLHFGVRLNGEYVNPGNYISY